MADDYEVIAHYYDALAQARKTDEVRGDKRFYIKEAVTSGGPVLEFGAGTLRISLGIAEAGISISAVDNSPAMIEIAKAKRRECSQYKYLDLYLDDMRTFSLLKEFSLVIITFRAFQNLLTPEDQRQCLTNTLELLKPGGKIVFDIFDPRFEMLAPNLLDSFGTPVRFLCKFKNPESGNTVSVSLARTSIDRVTQTFTEQWIFDERKPKGEMTRTVQELTLRWSYRYEIQYLLELCGFRVLNLFGDFARSPFCYGKHQIWVAQKPL